MDRPLFLFGTLCDMALLEAVLGRPVDSADTTAATLPDHAAHLAEGHNFPLRFAQAGAALDGVLVQGLTPGDLARLDYYESGFDYRLHDVQVVVRGRPVAARAYDAPAGGLTPGAPWDLAAWQQGWGPVTRSAAAEVMAHFGKRPAAEVAARYPLMLRRAHARLLAQDGPPARLRSRFGRDDVTVSADDFGYSEFFAMRDFDLSHPRFDGQGSLHARRACFIGYDAAIVLPYDPRRDRVLLVEQFRVGPYARGAAYPWSLEPVAGHVDLGERPEDAALRETREEAGVELRALEPIARTYPSPGCSSEFYHIFLGLCDLPDDAAGNGGLDCEGEDIRGHLLSYDALMALLDSGEAENGPLVLAALWLARNRTRLRAGA